jgi:hypothetical protein
VHVIVLIVSIPCVVMLIVVAPSYVEVKA